LASTALRTAPAGDQHLGAAQGLGHGGIGEVLGDERGVDPRQLLEAGQQRRREEFGQMYGIHGEEGERRH
jgi:hypothetical protein